MTGRKWNCGAYEALLDRDDRTPHLVRQNCSSPLGFLYENSEKSFTKTDSKDRSSGLGIKGIHNVTIWSDKYALQILEAQSQFEGLGWRSLYRMWLSPNQARSCCEESVKVCLPVWSLVMNYKGSCWQWPLGLWTLVWGPRSMAVMDIHMGGKLYLRRLSQHCPSAIPM